MHSSFPSTRSHSAFLRKVPLSLLLVSFSIAPLGAVASDAVAVSVAPERRVLASETPESVMVKVGLSGASLPSENRPPVNLALVLDRSGSMQGDRIVRAREAAIAAVERLDERDFVSVVLFDDRIDVLAGAQTASKANKSAIIEKLRMVQARGATAIFGGVSTAATELRKNLERKLVNRIILLSDGEANVGPSSPQELGLLGASLVKEGISVSTMGVGLGYNENLMAELARRSDGNTYFIENSDDMPRIFGAELGDVLSVAARDVKLTIRFRDASPVELVGRDGRIEDGVVTVDFNQIYARQEKFVLVRTEFPIGKDGETRAFASAEATWTLPGTGKRGSATATGSIFFSADSAKVKASVDSTVLVQSVKTQNAVRQERALELNRAGRYEDASSLMFSNSRFADEQKKLYDGVLSAEAEKDLAEESSMNTSFGRAVAAPAAPDAAKKIRAKSFQTQQQQQIPAP